MNSAEETDGWAIPTVMGTLQYLYECTAVLSCRSHSSVSVLAGTGALAINLFADLMVQGNLVSCR